MSWIIYTYIVHMYQSLYMVYELSVWKYAHVYLRGRCKYSINYCLHV